MAIEPNAKDVPQVAWEYWGTVEFMLDNPGMYIMDDRRSDCHDRLCKHYKLSKDATKVVTDNLDKYDNAVQMHDALLAI